jgi:hypothetical protein
LIIVVSYDFSPICVCICNYYHKICPLTINLEFREEKKMFKSKFIQSFALALTLLVFAGVTANAQSFSEGFDVVSPLPAGWFQSNQSTSIGTTPTWFQGGTTWAAQTGAANSWIGVNFRSTTLSDTISNWLVTPNRTLRNGDVIRFWTRTATLTATNPFPDRLQVRMSLNGTSTNVGVGPLAVGDFTTLLLDINPTYTVGAYPQVWTEQTITLSGIATPTSGRIALRYFVEDGGPDGANSNIIGVDTFSYTAVPVAPTTFPRSDFDGDGKSDLSVFRPSTGQWYIRQSGGADIVRPFGISTDVIAPADYDGDNKVDVAVFRATATAGMPDFYVLRSSDNTLQGAEWGTTGDVPVVADYDGDNKDDFAIYRNSLNGFYVLQSQTGTSRFYKFGSPGDKPTCGLFAGNDAKADFSVYRPSTGTWWIADSVANTVTSQQWGNATDIPVHADYDGDGKDDIAVFRPSEGRWYIRNSMAGTVSYVDFGTSTDIPVPGDYDGDSKYDQAVYRGGSWIIRNNVSGAVSFGSFGTATDQPTERWYLPQ